jgi:hypothetical protein
MGKKANPRTLDFAKKNGVKGEIERGKERSTRVRRHGPPGPKPAEERR